MRILTAILFFGALFCLAAPAIPADQDRAAAGTAAPPSPPRSTADWIEALGAESYQLREQASAQLWQLGDEIEAELLIAANSKDPEVAHRSRELLRNLALSITPETPSAVAEMVRAFTRANLSQKVTLFRALGEQQAWQPMLKLFAREESPRARDRLQKMATDTALLAARLKLLAGDAAAARELLELAPAEESSLRAMAAFHASQGTLAEEVQRAQQTQAPDVWLLQLYLVEGKEAQSAQLAAKQGRGGVLSMLELLQGDPIPWMRGYANQESPDSLTRAHALLAVQRYQNKPLRARDLREITRVTDADREGFAQFTALAALGFDPFSLESAPAPHPIIAFTLLNAAERTDEAIAAIGLDPESLDFAGWFKLKLQQLAQTSEDDTESYQSGAYLRREIMVVAAFMEQRGLAEKAAEVLGDPMIELAQSDLIAFRELLDLFFDRRSIAAPKVGQLIAARWAGDDPERWEDVRASAFGDNELSVAWWNWLEELEPDFTSAERLAALLAAFNLGDDPTQLREQVYARCWEAIESTPRKDRQPLLEQLFYAATSRMGTKTADANMAYQVWSAFSEEEQSEIHWGVAAAPLTALGHWNEAANLVLSRLDQAKNEPAKIQPILHGYAAAYLRHAGRIPEAKAHDAWAETLYLGDPALALYLGEAYAAALDYPRAEVWWRRALLLADPYSAVQFNAIARLGERAIAKKEWSSAAALNEVAALISDRLSSSLPVEAYRLRADLAKALRDLRDQPDRSLKLLEACHQRLLTNAMLADDFFPALRDAGLMTYHDQWFNLTWAAILRTIERFPDSPNTLNSAAWLAARARRELPQAMKFMRHALDLAPLHPAYLDTFAELHFAAGDRQAAVYWSGLAVANGMRDPMIMEQHLRFQREPLPQRKP